MFRKLLFAVLTLGLALPISGAMDFAPKAEAGRPLVLRHELLVFDRGWWHGRPQQLADQRQLLDGEEQPAVGPVLEQRRRLEISRPHGYPT